MKILITGSAGMLGRTLVSVLSPVHELITFTHAECDITDSESISNLIQHHRPEVVIHCAALTAVDKCESEVDRAYKTNVIGTQNIAYACNKVQAKLIAISTDYVFDGRLDRPYHEFDVANGGETVYGKSKWAAEECVRYHCPNHIIARVSWLYGAGGPSFVHTMLRLADGTRPEIKVVNDQIGNPTSCKAVADALAKILKHKEIVGTIHLTCEGEASWYEFAKKIFEIKKKSQRVVPCSSEEYVTSAKRPSNSRLEKRVLRLRGLDLMPQWEVALKDFLDLGKDKYS